MTSSHALPSSGNFLRMKSCYQESFRFLCLCLYLPLVVVVVVGVTLDLRTKTDSKHSMTPLDLDHDYVSDNTQRKNCDVKEVSQFCNVLFYKFINLVMCKNWGCLSQPIYPCMNKKFIR